MTLIYFLLIGLAAGWCAGKIMKTSYGLLGNLIVGVIGAFVGGLLFGLLGLGPTNLVGELISAVVGAVVFVWLLRYLKRK
ncbi:MAG: GlsB/YeaQ/YmgE family stress response membrane protein [Pirellulales bacterium]|nr:GlsB/YeaQ/YmgE family stress response membrane protein [Pirellulales bacterium]